MFDYLDYKNKIPTEKIVQNEILKIYPKSVKFLPYWRDQKRRCIEGTWVEHDGDWKWIPGSLFFYTNHWHILLNEKGSKSKTKQASRPFLRDLEWIKHYVYAVVRGFSGFVGDSQFTCHNTLNPEDGRPIEEKLEELRFRDSIDGTDISSELYREDGTLKTYVPPLEYLYGYFKEDLGKPLYSNDALNVIDIEARGGGKSYTMSAIVAHNFLFDGAMDYDELLAKAQEGKPLSSESLIGSIDNKYTDDLFNKFKLGIDTLLGDVTINNRTYPSPLSKKFKKSPKNPNTYIQEYSKKIGGKWVDAGNKTKLQLRTFKDNPFAANGTRPGILIVDEVGFMNNLVQAWGQFVECTADGGKKFGTIWATGTGGDMIGGATEEAKAVFYNPRSFTCIEFDDIFENSGKKIGFFVPAWMTLNDYKDKLGNTDRARAMLYLNREREKKKRATDKSVYTDELQQRPIYPSEAFLLVTGNILPVGDLQQQLKWVESELETNPVVAGEVGQLVADGSGFKFIPGDQATDRSKLAGYPVDAKKQDEGILQVWEKPVDGAGYGFYVAGCDPYNKDQTTQSISLGSIFIIRRASVEGFSYDKIVAEYTGRPTTADNFYEIVRRLLVYYNALCLYENNFNGLKTYINNKHQLHLLAQSPGVMKSIKNDADSNQYGLYMANDKVKGEGELYLRDWLLEEVGEGKLQLHYIYSVALLKELIAYHAEGNFDRAIALMLAVVQVKQMYHVEVEVRKEEIQRDPFFSRRLFVNTNSIY